MSSTDEVIVFDFPVRVVTVVTQQSTYKFTGPESGLWYVEKSGRHPTLQLPAHETFWAEVKGEGRQVIGGGQYVTTVPLSQAEPRTGECLHMVQVGGFERLTGAIESVTGSFTHF